MDRSDTEVEVAKQMIRDMVHKFRPDIQLYFSEGASPNHGFFQPLSNEIKLYTESIHKHAIKNNWEVIDTFIIVAAHELGHASDDELIELLGEQERLIKEINNFSGMLMRERRFTSEDFHHYHDLFDEYSRVTIKIEINAKEMGARFVPENILQFYEEDNNNNLWNYHQICEKMRDAYRILTALRDKSSMTTSEARKLNDDKAREKHIIFNGGTLIGIEGSLLNEQQTIEQAKSLKTDESIFIHTPDFGKSCIVVKTNADIVERLKNASKTYISPWFHETIGFFELGYCSLEDANNHDNWIRVIIDLKPNIMTCLRAIAMRQDKWMGMYVVSEDHKLISARNILSSEDSKSSLWRELKKSKKPHNDNIPLK